MDFVWRRAGTRRGHGCGRDAPATDTLHFENARVLSALCANDLGLLRVLEDKIGVKVTSREGWVKLDGEPDKVTQARRVFEQLEQARQNGVAIRKHEFLYAVRSVAESHGAATPDLSSLASVKIHTSAKRPPVVAKTAGQLEYVHTIGCARRGFRHRPGGHRQDVPGDGQRLGGVSARKKWGASS